MSHAAFAKSKLAERMAEELLEAINRQAWGPVRKLPAVRELAREFKVSPNTANSAVKLLAKRGVIHLQPRQGAFVQRVERATSNRNQIGIVWQSQPVTPIEFSQDDWTSQILRSAEVVLHEMGYYTTALGYDSPQLYERVEPMLPHLGGILTFAKSNITPMLDRLDKWDLPWVTISAPARKSVHNFVAADNHGDCARLGQAMAETGVRRVLVLTNALTAGSSRMEKLLGLFEGFTVAGVSVREIEVVNCENYHERFGYEAMLRRLSARPWPQVVFGNGDLLAIGAIRACRERGVRVPEDIGVIGATGLHVAELSHPSLTVVAQPMAEMGRQAAQMLVEMSRDGTRRLIGRRIAGQFIMRESFVLATHPAGEQLAGVAAAEGSGAPIAEGGLR